MRKEQKKDRSKIEIKDFNPSRLIDYSYMIRFNNRDFGLCLTQPNINIGEVLSNTRKANASFKHATAKKSAIPFKQLATVSIPKPYAFALITEQYFVDPNRFLIFCALVFN